MNFRFDTSFTHFDVLKFKGVVAKLRRRAEALCTVIDERLYSVTENMPVMHGTLSLLQLEVVRIAGNYVDMTVDYAQSGYTTFPLKLVPSRLFDHVPGLIDVPELSGEFKSSTKARIGRFLEACSDALDMCTTTVVASTAVSASYFAEETHVASMSSTSNHTSEPGQNDDRVQGGYYSKTTNVAVTSNDSSRGPIPSGVREPKLTTVSDRNCAAYRIDPASGTKKVFVENASPHACTATMVIVPDQIVSGKYRSVPSYTTKTNPYEVDSVETTEGFENPTVLDSDFEGLVSRSYVSILTRVNVKLEQVTKSDLAKCGDPCLRPYDLVTGNESKAYVESYSFVADGEFSPTPGMNERLAERNRQANTRVAHSYIDAFQNGGTRPSGGGWSWDEDCSTGEHRATDDVPSIAAPSASYTEVERARYRKRMETPNWCHWEAYSGSCADEYCTYFNDHVLRSSTGRSLVNSDGQFIEFDCVGQTMTITGVAQSSLKVLDGTKSDTWEYSKKNTKTYIPAETIETRVYYPKYRRFRPECSNGANRKFTEDGDQDVDVYWDLGDDEQKERAENPKSIGIASNRSPTPVWWGHTLYEHRITAPADCPGWRTTYSFGRVAPHSASTGIDICSTLATMAAAGCQAALGSGFVREGFGDEVAVEQGQYVATGAYLDVDATAGGTMTIFLTFTFDD